MNRTIVIGLTMMAVGFSMMWLGKAFRRRAAKPKETEEEWRRRLDRQEDMIDRMDDLRAELEEYNEELKRSRRLYMESEGEEACRHWIRGAIMAEQGEAMAAELEALIARYEREYGRDNAKV